jgi:hypothetical protein
MFESGSSQDNFHTDSRVAGVQEAGDSEECHLPTWHLSSHDGDDGGDDDDDDHTHLEKLRDGKSHRLVASVHLVVFVSPVIYAMRSPLDSSLVSSTPFFPLYEVRNARTLPDSHDDFIPHTHDPISQISRRETKDDFRTGTRQCPWRVVLSGGDDSSSSSSSKQYHTAQQVSPK